MTETKRYLLIDVEKHAQCWKCDKTFVPGDEVRQVTITLPTATCEHNALVRNVHSACAEQ